jgi:hypothetical protein
MGIASFFSIAVSPELISVTLTPSHRYLVYLNYPEITGNFLAGGFNNLSATEQDNLRTTLFKTMPELRKAFGPSVADAIEAVVEQRAEAVKNAQHPHKSKVHAGIGQLHYRKYYFANADQQGTIQFLICVLLLFIYMFICFHFALYSHEMFSLH